MCVCVGRCSHCRYVWSDAIHGSNRGWLQKGNVIAPLDKCMILIFLCLTLMDKILPRLEGLWGLYITKTSLSYSWNPASFQEFYLDRKEFECVTLPGSSPVIPTPAPCFSAGCPLTARAGLSSIMSCCSSPSTHQPSLFLCTWHLQSSGKRKLLFRLKSSCFLPAC